MTITIEKTWDGNERVREGRNGRVYVSRGRWVWVVLVDGGHDSDHESAGAARARACELKGGSK